MKQDLERQQRWLEHADAIVSSARFRDLHRRRERTRWTLTAAALAVGAGFTACMCFAPGFIAKPLAGTSVTWGIVLTIICLLLGTAIAGIYVFAAERLLDRDGLRDWSELP